VDKNCEINVRIDKWLWAVRAFKTRSLAADACKNNRVSICGVNVKPSRAIKIGEVVEIKRPPIVRKLRVTGLLAKRLSAALARDYACDITPIEEIEQIRLFRMASNALREPGAGRPTKKDMRDITEFVDAGGDYWDDMEEDA
jgi:ribosome-associated heat shock protein Hsp15